MPTTPDAANHSPNAPRTELCSPNDSTHEHDVALILGSLVNGHWAFAVYAKGSDVGRLFHVRNSDAYDPDLFFYEEREQKIEMEGVVGRSVLGSLFSKQRTRLERIIRDYAAQYENIPRYSDGRNCQTFCTELIGRFEDEGLVRAGSKAFWNQQRGCKGVDIAASLENNEMSWIKRMVEEREGPAGAKYQIPNRAPPPRHKLDTQAFEGLLSCREMSAERQEG